MIILYVFLMFLGFFIFCFGLYLLSCVKRIDDVYVIPVCGPDTPEYIKDYIRQRKRENEKYIFGIFWIINKRGACPSFMLLYETYLLFYQKCFLFYQFWIV